MKILIWLVLSFCLTQNLVAQDKSNNKGQDNEQCETRRVINETTGSVHVITTCVDNAPIKKTTSKDNQEITNDIGKPFNRFIDIDAQVSMAHSTYWLKWFTLVGVVVGIIGLIVLGKTLRETRVASSYALDTLNTARDEYRCELTITVISESHHVGSWPCDIPIRANVINIGKTAAYNCQIRWGSVTKERANAPRVITGFGDPVDINESTIGAGASASIGKRKEYCGSNITNRTHAVRIECLDKYTGSVFTDYLLYINIMPSGDPAGDRIAIQGRAVHVGSAAIYDTGVDTAEDAMRKANEDRKKNT